MPFNVQVNIAHVSGLQVNGLINSGPCSDVDEANQCRDETQHQLPIAKYLVVFKDRADTPYINGRRVSSIETCVPKAILEQSVVTFYVLEDE
jgi:hypothetical protein